MAIDGLLSLLLAVAMMVALVPTAAAAAASGGGAPAGAAGGASSLWGHGRRPGAFTWSLFGFGVGLPLPDLRIPSSPIEVKLVTQRVLDPIHYGNFCGPSPEITPEGGCKHPLNLASLDESDEVCRLHDHYYCKCDSIYTQRGQSPPSSVLIATRSLSSNVRKDYFAKLDKEYTLCIHEADKEMIGRFDRMATEGHLPEAYWDPVTRWKFDSLLDMFRRNLDLDNELLAIRDGPQARTEDQRMAPQQQQQQQQQAPITAVAAVGAAKQ